MVRAAAEGHAALAVQAQRRGEMSSVVASIGLQLGSWFRRTPIDTPVPDAAPARSTSRTKRSRHRVSCHALVILILVIGLLGAPSVAVAGGAAAAPTHASATFEPQEAARWGYLIGLGVVLLLLLLFAAARPWRGLFVGQDNRISTSKTVATVWTLVVAAAFLGAVYANIIGHPQPLTKMGNTGIVGQYALLFGGPLGAAILAKQIVNTQTTSGTSTKTGASAPTLSDLVANDAGDTDLGDLQYVLFNFVALVFVIAQLVHAPADGLPHIPDVLLGLTSVSAVGYVGKKALVPTGTLTAEIDPNHGPMNTALVVTVSGILVARATLAAWVRFGDTQAGQQVVASAPVVNGQAALPVPAPDIGAAANTAVDVVVVTDDGAVIRAGQYTYE